MGGMARWVRMVVLVAIAALLANSQCYARCLASVQQEASSAHSGCHHSSSSKHGSKSQCDDQHHSESVTAETRVDVAKVSTSSLAPIAMLFSVAPNLSVANCWLASRSLPERASPPDKPLFLAISILRL